MASLTAAAAAVIILLIITFTTPAHNQEHDQSICISNGLHPNYDSDCEEYYRCSEGKITERFKCKSGHVFNIEEQSCIKQDIVAACVRLSCNPGDTGSYVVPGTSCMGYYRCQNGTISRHICQTGTWFDADRNSCAAGRGTCYEPLCTSLMDGHYQDPTEHCRREYVCRGGRVVGVQSCQHACNQPCPPAMETSIPNEMGENDAGGMGCEGQLPGPTGMDCGRWVECGFSGNVVKRGRCDAGTKWNDQLARCVLGYCDFGDECKDGLNVFPVRDRWDCAALVLCDHGQVVGWGRCSEGTLFDGQDCVPPSQASCSVPVTAFQECESRSEGEEFADVESECRNYIRCEGGVKTVYKCQYGKRYADQARQCVRGNMWCGQTLCETGFLQGGCRGYYWSCGGPRVYYTCPKGTQFTVNQCVQPGTHNTLPFCLKDNGACKDLTDGYHYNEGCSVFTYCENGDRLFVDVCPKDLVFNGKQCVSPKLYTCPKPSTNLKCPRDGFSVKPNTNCVNYYICIAGTRTELECPNNKIFNGKKCVYKSQYTCPL